MAHLNILSVCSYQYLSVYNIYFCVTLSNISAHICSLIPFTIIFETTKVHWQFHDNIGFLLTNLFKANEYEVTLFLK